MGIRRGPADWVSYEDDETGKRKIEYVLKGMEKDYYPRWKLRHEAEKTGNWDLVEKIDNDLDKMTDWNFTKKYGNLNDQQANMADDLRMMGAPDDIIARKMADPRGVIRDRREVPDLVGPNIPTGHVGGTPEELRLAQEEWDAQNAPIGTGTGVDPRQLPGEWKNGVLEIPSTEGGLGLRINLNDQPYMNKKRKK